VQAVLFKLYRVYFARNTAAFLQLDIEYCSNQVLALHVFLPVTYCIMRPFNCEKRKKR